MTPQPDDLPDIAAQRTYALVVGVESYDVSSGWRLPGAALDAHHFARWLTGSGQVPPANVRLFLSPLPSTTVPCVDDFPEHLPATEANIKQALLHELPSCDGDLLWIYWAGHGFVDDHGDALLPYSNAAAPSISNLNLGSALRLWKSTSVAHGRFRHQVAVVDACRVDRRRTPKLHFEAHEYGKGAMTDERRQFVLYAAPPGGAARNEAGRQSGLFTRSLLHRLDGLSVGQGTHRLTAIAHGVQADFDELRQAKGGIWQTPTFEIHRGWNGSAIFGDAWTASAPSGAPQLDQEAWNRLAALTKGRGLPPYAHDAYRWAFDVCECAAPLAGSPPMVGLTEIVRDLDARQGRPGIPLTLPFVRYLAAHAQDREWGARLDAWVEDTRARIGAGPVPPAPEPPTEPAALHVQLAKDHRQDDAYTVRIWRYEGRFTSEWESEASLKLSEARSEVGGRIAALIEEFDDRDPQGIAPGVGRIEVHIPRKLIDEEFEGWAVPAGPEGTFEPMGVLFEVVVRCPDERRGAARQKWRQKWESFERHGKGRWEAPTLDARHPIWLLAEDQAPGILSRLLQAGELPVCVLVPGDRALLSDALDAAHMSGVPIVVWRRGAPLNGSAGDLPSALTASGDEIDLRNLPSRLRRRRIEASVALSSEQADQGDSHPFALLWDDPNRRPDPRALRP
ncbi:caspase family protein [Streptomyces sp. NBC_00287]|uniref:VMAP-C domain-containing protein n=1 Tax=Streptomyces sp. NBC_00287 TaxID=2975702 RepID=UPI002E2C4943|nr:hypothetical protein [Streptomyces sp. NBC_00287]